jgi:hypothetical protein
MPHKFDLLLSWINDLFFLTGTQLPVYFTCANHYADVSGEITIMYHVLGAILTLLPQENPFSFASTLIPPEEEWRKKGNSSQPTEFSRGNSYFYGVQHCDKQRRKRIALNGDDKSRILGSLITYLTQKIEVDDLMKTLTSAALNFERREGPLVSSPTESVTSKATGPADGPAMTTAPATTGTTAKTPAVAASKASATTPSKATALVTATATISAVKATDEAKETTNDHTSSSSTVSPPTSNPATSVVSDTSSSVTATMPSAIRNDFFANVSKLGQSTIANTSGGGGGGGPGSTRSGYSSKSSSPGTGLRNESRLLATIRAAKSGSGSVASLSSSPRGLSPAVSPCPSTTTSLCGDTTAAIPTATTTATTTTTPLPSMSTPPATLLESSVPSPPQPTTTTAAAAAADSDPIAEDVSLVHIEQSILPETRQLQILITSPLSPPHQPLQVNTLALNLHTSGQRLRISTPQSASASTSSSKDASTMYYSREIMLFQPVKCTPRDLEAKYSKKKNVLTVKIALAQETDAIDLGYAAGSA